MLDTHIEACAINWVIFFDNERNHFYDLKLLRFETYDITAFCSIS